MINSAIFIGVGNITDEPELHFTPSGAAVCNFSLAINERVKNQQTGEYEDGTPSFFRCAAWKGLAENVAESLPKGTRVIVYGTQKVRPFERQDGTKGTSVDINVEHIGPDLTWATAKVTRANRSGGNTASGQAQAQPAAEENPWATQPAAAAAPAAGVSADEPPF